MGVARGAMGQSRARVTACAKLACFMALGCQSLESSDDNGRGIEDVASTQFALTGSRAPGGARRLTATQYQRTITDILGPEAGSVAAAPQESAIAITSINAFEAPVSRSAVLNYESSAVAVVERALQFPARLAEHAPCVTQGPTDANFRRTCYQQVAHRVGYLAFRKPPSNPVKARLVDIGVLGEQEGTTDAEKLNFGLKYLLATVLEAPSFLYSVEIGTPSSVTNEFDLNAFELASRLSLFLLGRGPSEELLNRAAAGELSTPAGVRAVASELLATPEAREGLIDQLDETLQLKLLPTKGKDPVLFPVYDEELRDAMREEVQRFVLDIVFDSPRSFFAVLNDPKRFVNARLATDIYGIPAPASDWDLVDFSVAPLDQQKRAGLMTMPAMMTIHSHPAINSITRRGLFNLANLLCQTPNPLPRVDTSINIAADGTLREFMEQGPGVCGASCHGIQDKMGFAFENFDAIGRFRTQELTPNGTLRNVDPAVTADFAMFNGQNFPAYADAREWADSMADPAFGFSTCMVKHIYRNALGATVDTDQEAAVADLETQFAASGYLFAEALLDFVSSPLFIQVGPPR